MNDIFADIIEAGWHCFHRRAYKNLNNYKITYLFKAICEALAVCDDATKYCQHFEAIRSVGSCLQNSCFQVDWHPKTHCRQGAN